MFSRVRRELQVDGKTFAYYSLPELQDARVERLPYSVRVLLESAVRNCDDFAIKPADVDNILNWETTSKQDIEIPFKPARVILQDFTGVPAVVDLAAMRDAMKRLGGDPERINPLVPADLVIDHSVQVDVYGTPDAYEKNQDIEFERNEERFRFLKWGAQAFKNMLIVPPGSGIVHQVNLEYLARAVFSEDGVLYPDSVVGTDSHTTMINGLGIVGWGVGGIEAEAVMLGQAISMVLPQVVGFKLTGKLPEVATATDLVLTVTQMLRAKGVVGKFVEFFGPGCANLSIADRATISNMAPEYGATIGYFPPDEQTIEYMRTTGRDEDKLKYIEAYLRAQHMFRNYAAGVDPVFSDQLELDLATVEPCMSGPKRPHDRVLLSGMKADFVKCLTNKPGFKGFGVPEDKKDVKVTFNFNGHDYTIQQGAVVIASITSCTNTSNPSVLIGAGLLAKNAIEAGLNVKPFVKTSLSPGSLAVSQYLQEAGLQTFLDKLGFTTAGYGCMTCIAAGTPVLLANGTACRINKFSAAGGASLLSPFADGKLARASQTALLDNGVRDCVRLTFQDGRTLVCTPDHRLLCADDRWVAAGDLSLNKDRVVAGLEAPLDEPADDEAGYELLVGQRLFTMDAPADRQRALAFVRLLGHLLCDGSIGALKQGRLHVAHAVDRDAVLQDIELLTRERPAASQHDERTWAIILPTDLTADIIAVVGERIEQVPRLPAFILDERCPVAVVREFLGGVFGADGQGPVLRRVSQVAEFVHPMLSQSASPEHADALEDVMRDLLRLLTRCGVETAKAKIYRRSTSTPRVEVRLALTDGLSFVERVGFRYCVDKTMRASAASVYWRTIAKTPCMTSPAKVLEQLGVREWFAPRAKRNGVNKTGDRLPTFSLSVINRRCAGPHPVFDLTVEGPHAFIAGGVAVHNCIGNSGPLPEAVAEAIEKEDLVAAAVLSGNRNFEGRVNPHTKANYLASPPLCVAYALAGTVNIDFKTEPIGTSVATGKPVFLSDIWPSRAQIQAVVDKVVQPQMFKKSYSVVTTANPRWNALTPPAGRLYEWDVSSTYIKCPPFFNAVTKDLPKHGPIKGAHALLNLGDSITTDHISPAGNIARNSAAARFLASKGVSPRDFNSYGSRRGNDEVMARGTFANTQITNKLIGKPGPKTVHVPSGEVLDTYDAAERYIRDGVPLIVLAGAEYGSGSSRDWAAKGPYLQGIKAVIAISYERIHRSNLVGMGIIPLQFPAGQNADTLGLTGKEQFDIDLPDNIQPGMDVTVRTSDGKTFQTKLRFDTEVELTYFKNGGILQYMLRKLSV